MKILGIVALVVLAACGTASKMMPSAEGLPAMQQKVPGMTLERAQKGFATYKEKCSGCHRLHSPSEYTVSGWDKSLAEMFPKAKVKDAATQDLVRDYLHALSK